ncbi:hypothetical protein NPIL_167131 [Nephila pilipes]|uniref:Uncharacterized protein n=1 Tax=Nephila pilipes TaxID=299642 RepID=A0A8X6NPG3_NEPPI|nr:hypothetical protein NPIL_167131 [Nephila pilipes]
MSLPGTRMSTGLEDLPVFWKNGQGLNKLPSLFIGSQTEESRAVKPKRRSMQHEEEATGDVGPTRDGEMGS